MELPEASAKRFFVTAGYFSNREIADVIKEGYPDLADQLPGEDVKGDFDAEGEFKFTFRMWQSPFKISVGNADHPTSGI